MQAPAIHTPIIVTLPEGFPIKTNKGLHGDVQLFELSNTQLTACEPVFVGDTVSFAYVSFDSEEGEVLIHYQTQDGQNAADAIKGPNDGWDVSITTGSDVWGVTDTVSAIQDAHQLHVALGRHKPFMRD